MMKTLREVLEQQYPNLDFSEFAVFVSNNGNLIYKPNEWPPSGFGNAPSISQINTWMNS